MVWKYLANYLQENAHAEMWFTLPYGCSLVNLLHIFRTPLPRNTSWWLLLTIEILFSVRCMVLAWHRFHQMRLDEMQSTWLLCEYFVIQITWLGSQKFSWNNVMEQYSVALTGKTSVTSHIYFTCLRNLCLRTIPNHILASRVASKTVCSWSVLLLGWRIHCQSCFI